MGGHDGGSDHKRVIWAASGGELPELTLNFKKHKIIVWESVIVASSTMDQ